MQFNWMDSVFLSRSPMHQLPIGRAPITHRFPPRRVIIVHAAPALNTLRNPPPPLILSMFPTVGNAFIPIPQRLIRSQYTHTGRQAGRGWWNPQWATLIPGPLSLTSTLFQSDSWGGSEKWKWFVRRRSAAAWLASLIEPSHPAVQWRPSTPAILLPQQRRAGLRRHHPRVGFQLVCAG